MMKKVFMIIITILLLDNACQKKGSVLVANLCGVVDNLVYADSVRGDCQFHRCLLLNYRLVNNHNATYFLPIHNVMGYKDSTISLSLTDGNDVSPNYYYALLGCTAKNNIIHPKDTCYITVFVNSLFTDKTNKYTKAPTKDILSVLQTSFNLDSADLYNNCPKIPTVVFNNMVDNAEISYDIMSLTRAKLPVK